MSSSEPAKNNIYSFYKHRPMLKTDIMNWECPEVFKTKPHSVMKEIKNVVSKLFYHV